MVGVFLKEVSGESSRNTSATAGAEVIFCDILKDSGEGLVEFAKEDEALEAIKKFDDTEYESVTIKCEQAPPKPVEEASEAPVVSEDAQMLLRRRTRPKKRRTSKRLN